MTAQHTTLGYIELVIGLILCILILAMRRNTVLKAGSFIFYICMVVLFSALLIDGGVDGTGIYWLPIFPFIALTVTGLRRGCWIVASFLIVALAVFWLSANGMVNLPYSFHQYWMFLVSFFTFSVIAFCLASIYSFNTHRLHLAHEQLELSEHNLRKAHADLEVQITERTRHLAAAKKQLEREVEEKNLANERLRNTREKFFQAQKMEAIGTLVGGIAHDFNNMLSGITANLYLVKTRITDAPTIERLDKVDTLIMHAADMIRQMLTFARKDQVQLKSFDFNAFLKEAFKLAQVSISESIHTGITLPDKPMYIRGDVTQLQQVLMNLMNNARDALEGRPNPEIHVSLRSFQPDSEFRRQHPEQKARRYACLSVRDNGEGIPEEKISHIFEPFFTTKSVGRGTGLGLAMIYGAIESHGGVIEVQSQIGHGTTFLIYLPVVAQSESGLFDGGQDAVVSGQGEMLLLVDDDEYSRQANADVLQSLNYKVIEAANGLEAIRQFEQYGNDIDLILMDVVMPEMGGADAARRIRKSNKHIGIIFMTGYDKDKTLDGDITGEWENIITKPLTIEKLSSTVHRFFLKQLSNTHA
ncbi:MAG: ATP-binding protein [Mariprofundaceae bacterium]